MGFAIQRTADTAPADRSFPLMILASISMSPFTFKTDPQPKTKEKLKSKNSELRNGSQVSFKPLTLIHPLLHCQTNRFGNTHLVLALAARILKLETHI